MLFVFLLFFTSLSSQEFQCLMTDDPGGPVNNPAPETHTATITPHLCLVNCVDEDHSNDLYVPDQNSDDDLKTIKIALHIMQLEGNDPQNFTPAHKGWLKNIFQTSSNNFLSNLTCPVFNPDVGCDSPPGQSCLSTTCNSSNAQIGDCECAEDPNIDVLTDSKLRFELLDEDIYFWQDNVGWANNGWFCGAGTDCPPNNNNFPLEAVYNLDKYGVQGRLNVFVVGDISNGFRGCGMGYAGERIAHVTMLGLFERIFVPNGDGQRASKAFIHEVGHFMGLHHTNLNWQTNLFPDATGVLGGDDNDTGCPCRNGDNTSNNIMRTKS